MDIITVEWWAIYEDDIAVIETGRNKAFFFKVITDLKYDREYFSDRFSDEGFYDQIVAEPWLNSIRQLLNKVWKNV